MKILIAEDDLVTREALVTSLEREGFSVVACEDGRAALNQWEAEAPDLVCLDIMMPKVDGFQVCREIRKSNPTLPILFLSAKNEEIDVVTGLELGADDFIRKPFGKQELLARIRTQLRRISPPTQSIESFTMRDITVLPRELRATRDNQSVDLSPREISILQFLLENKDGVVSRDELMDHCWGVNYYPESRTLDQHISKLRKHLQSLGVEDLIETVRGVGYRFRN